MITPAVITNTTSPPVPEYRTQSLYQAAAFVIRTTLPYLRCELDPTTNRAWFVFEDRDHRGTELEREYLSADPLVPVRQLRDVVDTLRDRVRVVTAAGRRSGNVMQR
jgi:hypothetical protein